jgi:hypothetical protein
MGIIDDLKKARAKDCTFLEKVIEELYKKCLIVVKFKNKGGITSTVYQVPPLLVGHPVYDQQEACCLLNSKLRKNGFKTIYKPPFDIFISW